VSNQYGVRDSACPISTKDGGAVRGFRTAARSFVPRGVVAMGVLWVQGGGERAGALLAPGAGLQRARPEEPGSLAEALRGVVERHGLVDGIYVEQHGEHRDTLAPSDQPELHRGDSAVADRSELREPLWDPRVCKAHAVTGSALTLWFPRLVNLLQGTHRSP